jgi:hypothetical protein
MVQLSKLRKIMPFSSDQPFPHVLVWSGLLVLAAFSVVYFSVSGFKGVL